MLMNAEDKMDEINAADGQSPYSPQELARRDAVHMLTRVAIMTPVVMTMLMGTKANAVALGSGGPPPPA